MLDIISKAGKELSKIKELQKLTLGMGSYLFDRLIEYSRALFAFSPYGIGEKIKLAKTPKITNEYNSGWFCYKDFLIEGAAGIIVRIDYYDDKFVFDIEFDAIKGHTFRFNETWIKKEVLAALDKVVKTY